MYQWLAQGKLSQFYICHVCLSVHLSPSVQLSQFAVTWRDCISVCLQDCFQGDVIHPPVCHLSDSHKKLSVWLSVYLTDNRLHSTSDSCHSLQERKCQIKLQIGIFSWFECLSAKWSVSPVRMEDKNLLISCDILSNTHSCFHLLYILNRVSNLQLRFLWL